MLGTALRQVLAQLRHTMRTMSAGQGIGILYGYQGIDTDGHEDIQCLGLAFLVLEVPIIILVFGGLVSGNPQMQLPQHPCSLRHSNCKISNERCGDLLQSG